MAGLDPAIHGVRLPPHSEPVFRSSNTFRWDGVDGRVKPGHDGNVMISANAIALPTRGEGFPAAGACVFLLTILCFAPVASFVTAP